jgi:hypothetical protein
LIEENMGAGASTETNTRGIHELHRTWSFLDENGLHVVELFHGEFLIITVAH